MKGNKQSEVMLINRMKVQINLQDFEAILCSRKYYQRQSDTNKITNIS